MGDVLPFFCAYPRFKKIFHNYIKNYSEVKNDYRHNKRTNKR